jgi:hypothetical protein
MQQVRGTDFMGCWPILFVRLVQRSELDPGRVYFTRGRQMRELATEFSMFVFCVVADQFEPDFFDLIHPLCGHLIVARFAPTLRARIPRAFLLAPWQSLVQPDVAEGQLALPGALNIVGG